MHMIFRFVLIFYSLTLVTSCASIQPTNFYTLSKPLTPLENNKSKTLTIKNANLARVSVNVPDGLKRPQLVINHKNDTRLFVLEHDRWLSAFDDELKDAITSGINAGRKNESLLTKNRYRITIDLLQMDTYISDKVTANFYWHIERENTSKESDVYLLNCQFSATKTIGNRIESAVEGIQAIVQDLINVISQQIQSMESGPLKECN